MTLGTFLKYVGFALLVPSVVFGLAPYLVGFTELNEQWSDFSFSLGNTTLASYESATSHLYVTPIVWVFAALGELALIAKFMIRPPRKASHILTIY